MFRLRHGQTVTPTQDPAIVRVSGNCMLSGEPHSFEAPIDGLNRWLHNGELIQIALRDLSFDDREFLVSGVGPNAFDLLMDDEAN